MARKGENIRKRADGRWEARVIIGYGPTGKAIYKSVYAKTYGEVREKKKRVPARESAEGIICQDRKITFSQLMDAWLSYSRNHVKESTFAKYVQLNSLHIAPLLGPRCLTMLTSQDLEDYALEMLRNGKRDGTGGLSPKTVADILNLVKQAIRFGQERGYSCPANLTVRYPKQKIPQIQILSQREQQRLEQFICGKKEPVYLGILLSLYTGLRIGEVCALRWGDFRFDRGTVSVEKTIMRIQNTERWEAEDAKTKLLVDAPKSPSSVRTIPLPPFLMDYMQALKRPDHCYILTGGPTCLEPRNYYRKYKKIMEECGLESFNYHALRHTFATRCVEKGFDTKSLSEILGHADVSTTLRRYVHPTLEMKRRQMEKLESEIIQGQKNGQ